MSNSPSYIDLSALRESAERAEAEFGSDSCEGSTVDDGGIEITTAVNEMLIARLAQVLEDADRAGSEGAVTD